MNNKKNPTIKIILFIFLVFQISLCFFKIFNVLEWDWFIVFLPSIVAAGLITIGWSFFLGIFILFGGHD